MARINQQGKILNSSRLSAQIEKIPPEDSFHASKRGEYNEHYQMFLNMSITIRDGKSDKIAQIQKRPKNISTKKFATKQRK